MSSFVSKKTLTRSAVLGGVVAITVCVATANAQTQIAQLTPIEETSLSRDVFATGVLSEKTGALGEDLWAGSITSDLDLLLSEAPVRYSAPSYGAAMRRLLLSPGETPAGAPASLGGKKLLVLAEAGLTEEVRTIAGLSSARASDPRVGKALAITDLLENNLDAACRRSSGLASGRDAPFWVKLRVLCYAQSEEFDAAELNLRILREQGALSDADNAFLTAASIPAPLASPTPPETALHLAALRLINPDLSAATTERASAGVLKSLARDPKIDARVRLQAASRAAVMGVLSVDELRSIYESAPETPDDPASVRGLLSDKLNDPLTDVAVYRAVKLMSAPEFLRDRGALIATAINNAPSFARGYATAMMFADDVHDLEGVLVAPSEAGAFALARMSAGDASGASRWLLTMLGGGLSTLDEETALLFMERTNLLAMLDPVAAGAVSAAANASIAPPRGLLDVGGPVAVDDRARLAQIIEAAFHAAANEGRGQAGLAALALSHRAFAGDAVARVVRRAALKSAGFDSLARQIAFEEAWRSGFPDGQSEAPPPSSGEPAEERGFAPRLKPGRD